MAVMKLTKSGLAFQIILGDESFPPGTVLQVPRSMVAALNSGVKELVVLTRLAYGVSPGKFAVSSVWGDSHVERFKRSVEDRGVLSSANDSLSSRFVGEREDRSRYSGGKVVRFDE